MLPRATTTRNRREAVSGKQGGRTQEIQRLIGRSLRAGVDRQALGERQIVIDCDVLEADGGTRCASITGGWWRWRWRCGSCRCCRTRCWRCCRGFSCFVRALCGQPVLDLDYAEDSTAGVDGNFVMTGAGRLVEVQMSAEGSTFGRDEMDVLMGLAAKGVRNWRRCR